MNSPVRVMIFAAEPGQGAKPAAALEAHGYSVVQHHQLTLVAEVLRRERPALVVVAAPNPAELATFANLGEAARGLKIPTLVLTTPTPGLGAQLVGFDDWVDERQAATELPIRADRLLSRPSADLIPIIDPRFLAVVVHDIRTPLNVIGLTIRAIGHSVPNPSPDFEEDLSFLHENAKQIEKMLAQLGDYCRLIESEQRPSAVEFGTRRFLADFLEEKQSKRESEFKSVRLEIATDAPEAVTLDPNRVRLAIHHALANAVAAAGDAPVKLRSRGPADHWTIDVVVEKSPPPTITPTRLQPHVFERLIGSAAERRGLDLAIAARISESFGGSARLDLEPGVRSVVSIDWPTRPPT